MKRGSKGWFWMTAVLGIALPGHGLSALGPQPACGLFCWARPQAGEWSLACVFGTCRLGRPVLCIWWADLFAPPPDLLPVGPRRLALGGWITWAALVTGFWVGLGNETSTRPSGRSSREAGESISPAGLQFGGGGRVFSSVLRTAPTLAPSAQGLGAACPCRSS